MFAVYGDEITLDHQTVATLSPKLPLGKRDDIVILLESFLEEDDIDAKIEAAKKESYDDGLDVGKDDGRAEAKEELELAREKIEEAAFNEGRADALSSCDRASDVARVDALLLALAKIHDALRTTVLGVDVGGQFCRRPIKISEAKRAAQICMSDAKSALYEYNKPNGA